jgi:homoserine kinase
MIRIRVPATTTNLGPGFDCLGVALDIFNIIEVEEKAEGLEICVPENQRKEIPLDDSNLVYVAMKKVFDKIGYPVKGLRINLKSDIPLTRGLGSSAACIVGGLTAGNELAGRVLSKTEITQMAVEMDGHPDNVVPALEGGMVIACMDEERVLHFRFDPPEDVKFALLIPDFYLPTVQARKVIPKSITVKDAVFNISRVALVTASLLTGNLDLLHVGVQDRIHQPYRKHLIPHWDEVISQANELGAKGVFLSGAGPTVIAVIDRNYQEFQCEMQRMLGRFKEKWTVQIVNACRRGVEVL